MSSVSLWPRMTRHARRAVTVLVVAAAALATWQARAHAAIEFPTPTGEQAVTETIQVTGSFDGGLVRYYGAGDLGTGGQEEDQGPLFELADGATLENVILGTPAADGVHCEGTCTLSNVWWEDVGEDAATFRDSATVDGGGARLAEDKVFQHNGTGTVAIRNFQVEDFGKLYRSCGNCSVMTTRHAVIENVTATAPGDAIAGINVNYGDTATFSDITIVGDDEMTVCLWYEGVEGDGEPTEIGEGPSENCRYDASDITFE